MLGLLGGEHVSTPQSGGGGSSPEKIGASPDCVVVVVFVVVVVVVVVLNACSTVCLSTAVMKMQQSLRRVKTPGDPATPPV